MQRVNIFSFYQTDKKNTNTYFTTFVKSTALKYNYFIKTKKYFFKITI